MSHDRNDKPGDIFMNLQGEYTELGHLRRSRWGVSVSILLGIFSPLRTQHPVDMLGRETGFPARPEFRENYSKPHSGSTSTADSFAFTAHFLISTPAALLAAWSATSLSAGVLLAQP